MLGSFVVFFDQVRPASARVGYELSREQPLVVMYRPQRWDSPNRS